MIDRQKDRLITFEFLRCSTFHISEKNFSEMVWNIELEPNLEEIHFNFNFTLPCSYVDGFRKETMDIFTGVIVILFFVITFV